MSMTMQADPGWYPDPTGQTGAQWYWDGTTWVSRTEPITDGERLDRLAIAVDEHMIHGWRVETQTLYQATLVSGSRCNHIAWMLAGVFTCGLAWIGWLIAAMTQKETHMTLRIDPYGVVVASRSPVGRM